MNPTARSLALLVLAVCGVYGQDVPSADSLIHRRSLFNTNIDNAFLTRYPSRSLQSLLTLTPGIADVNGDLHVRGSRANQTGFTFDGFSVLDRYSNTQFFEWDLRNESGWLVASGMFICHIELPDMGLQRVLKLAVIQENPVPD